MRPDPFGRGGGDSRCGDPVNISDADTNVGAVLDTVTFRSLTRAHSPRLGRPPGFARHLASAGVKVVEVNRPEKLDGYLDGKDDYLSAEAAARSVLSGRATAFSKSGDGPVEAIRSLETAHESAAHDRAEAINQFKSMMSERPTASPRTSLPSLVVNIEHCTWAVMEWSGDSVWVDC
ncbi:MAG: hypothetical protein ACI9N0_000249 [Ilumatobacter sp.]|jgi:hypothetical protein